MKRDTPKYIVQLSKELRKNQTSAEKIIWDKIRGSRLKGYKFRRQYAMLGRGVGVRVEWKFFLHLNLYTLLKLKYRLMSIFMLKCKVSYFLQRGNVCESFNIKNTYEETIRIYQFKFNSCHNN
jgi:hypothetical protein